MKYGSNLRDKYTDRKIDIDILLIENQIGPLALRMKTLQGMIMQHFIERNCKNIMEISPYNKLKKYISTKKKYSERKKLSIIEKSLGSLNIINGLNHLKNILRKMT